MSAEPVSSIMNSGDPLQRLLKETGWDLSADNFLGWMNLVVRHPQLQEGETELLLTTPGLSSLSAEEMAGRLGKARAPTCGVLLLDESLKDLEQDPDAEVGGLLITEEDIVQFHAPVASWARELSARLDGAEEDELSVASWVMSDRPIDDFRDDRFGFRAYAEAIAGVINDDRTDTPLVISINAPWGAGKSSLGKMIEKLLRERPAAGGSEPHVTLWFNAWLHDDADALESALITAIGQATDRFRSNWRDMLWRSPRIWGFLLVSVLLLVAALVARQVGFVPDATDDPSYLKLIAAAIPATGGVSGILGIVYLMIRFYSSWGLDLLRLINDRPGAAASVSMSQCRERLRMMINKVTPAGSRFVIFIDDIERCRPPTSVDLLEAVNQLLNFEPVVVVLMGDMPTVANQVDIKYRDLVGQTPSSMPSEVHVAGVVTAAPGQEDAQQFEGHVALGGGSPARGAAHLNSSDYGRRYLQKIVQLQFDMPVPDEAQIRELLASLSTQSVSVRPAEGEGTTAQERAEERVTEAGASVPGDEDPQPGKLRATPAWLEASILWSTRVTGMLMGILLLGVVIMALLSGWDVEVSQNAMAGLGTSVFALFMLLLLSAITQGALKQVRASYQARHAQLVAEKRITAKSEISKMGSTSPENLYQFEAEDSPDRLEDLLLEEQKRRFITGDSKLVATALNTIFTHMPMHPRNAKRILNKLRLIILIAYYRKVLSGNTAVTPQQIGKWVVLNERWPELAMALRDIPGRLKVLEQASTQVTGNTTSGGFQAAIDDFLPSFAGDAHLERFVAAEPQMAEVSNELICYTTSAA